MFSMRHHRQPWAASALNGNQCVVLVHPLFNKSVQSFRTISTWEADSLSYWKPYHPPPPALFTILPVLSFTASSFSQTPHMCISMCDWDACTRLLCKQICRLVVDRVHTLDVASIGLHFLHILWLVSGEEKKDWCHKQYWGGKSAINDRKLKQKLSSIKVTYPWGFGRWLLGPLTSSVRSHTKKAQTGQKKGLQKVFFLVLFFF